MPDRRDIAGWLPGSGGRPEPEGTRWPGKDLGRPEEGPRSIPPIGRRFVSLLIDWLLCWVIARAIFGPGVGQAPGAFWVNVVFAVENLILVGAVGSTLGQRLMGIRVETVEGAFPGVTRAAIRAMLLGLGLPALTLFGDRDQRGLHELASGTVVARI